MWEGGWEASLQTLNIKEGVMVHQASFFATLRGVPCAVRKVGYFGACGRTRNPYFMILGGV